MKLKLGQSLSTILEIKFQTRIAPKNEKATENNAQCARVSHGRKRCFGCTRVVLFLGGICYRSGFISPRNFNNGMSLRGPASCFRKKAAGTRQSLSTKARLLHLRLAVARQQQGRKDVIAKEVRDTYETTSWYFACHVLTIC